MGTIVLDEPKQKVYQAVLDEIRKYIHKNHLVPGDKIPSERHLAEKLNAGRSSVREALRAIELLGLIETRHGEGTYLRTYETFKSVELLSSFILLEGQTKKDLHEMKVLIEKEAVKLAFFYLDDADLRELRDIIQSDVTKEDRHAQFFNLIYKKADNQLLRRVGRLIEEFSRSVFQTYYEISFYEDLIKIIAEEDLLRIDVLYKNVAI